MSRRDLFVRSVGLSAAIALSGLAAPLIQARARAGVELQAAPKAAPKAATTPRTGSAGIRKYTYTLKDGKKITLDFPLFVEGQGQKVTKDVFRGYTLYNSYCYRCHGTDVTESELAPNLRHTLNTGMTMKQFLAVAMAGRPDKGMPSWGGFLTDEELTSIYRYVKGRSLELVPVGRPPSEFD